MRESTASTASTGEPFFFAIAAARSDADIQQRSLSFMVPAIVCCLATPAAAFGIFDHVDRSGEPLGALYEPPAEACRGRRGLSTVRPHAVRARVPGESEGGRPPQTP